jgi:hypothetical protein
MLKMLPTLPMLKIEPALPMLRTEPALPMLKIEPALPTLKILPTLPMLKMLSGLLMLRKLARPSIPSPPRDSARFHPERVALYILAPSYARCLFASSAQPTIAIEHAQSSPTRDHYGTFEDQTLRPTFCVLLGDGVQDVRFEQMGLLGRIKDF